MGGAELSVQALAESFYKGGHKVCVVTLGQKNEKSEINGVQIFRLKIQNIFWPFEDKKHSPVEKIKWHIKDIYNSSYKTQIEEIFKEFEPNIIHTNNLAGFSVYVWDIAKKHNIKITHTLRDYYLQCPRSTKFKNSTSCKNQCLKCSMFSLVKKKMSSKVDTVIGISQYILKDHLKQGFFQKSNKTVIYNGFNIPSDKKKKLQFDRNTYINFGFIGQVNEAKGIELLMKTLQNFKTLSNWKLFIAGNVQPNYLKNLKSHLPETKVEFMGFTKTSDFFQKINVLVVPSIWEEPFGRVVLEGITNNTVVLGSNSGGIPELLKSNQSFLFNPTETNLSILLKKILMDTSVLNSFKFDNKTSSMFCIERISMAYLSVFKKTINKDNESTFN